MSEEPEPKVEPEKIPTLEEAAGMTSAELYHSGAPLYHGSPYLKQWAEDHGE